MECVIAVLALTTGLFAAFLRMEIVAHSLCKRLWNEERERSTKLSDDLFERDNELIDLSTTCALRGQKNDELAKECVQLRNRLLQIHGMSRSNFIGLVNHDGSVDVVDKTTLG